MHFLLPIFLLVTKNAVSSYKTGILLESKNYLKANFVTNNLGTKLRLRGSYFQFKTLHSKDVASLETFL